MEESRLVVCTVGSLTKEDAILSQLLGGKLFDEVLLDESSTIKAIDVYMVFEAIHQYLAPQTEFTLTGDPCQEPPGKSPLFQKANYLSTIGAGVSIIDWVIEWIATHLGP